DNGLLSIKDGEVELFNLSKANVESILDLFDFVESPEQFDPITKWERENPELFAAAKDKFCCLHILKQEIVTDEVYGIVKSKAIKKFGQDEVEKNCYFFQGPKSTYQIHTMQKSEEPI